MFASSPSQYGFDAAADGATGELKLKSPEVTPREATTTGFTSSVYEELTPRAPAGGFEGLHADAAGRPGWPRCVA